MEIMIVFCLLAILSPISVGITMCLWRFFEEKCDKTQKYFMLRKEERQMQRSLREYSDWYNEEQIAILKACILNNRHERTNIFSLDDLKVWKAFI